jgi:RNAse (barnase) inhibitor barstar
MKVIRLDASGWRSTEDFYSELLPQLGAPGWHGRNLDALEDSLYGGINQVEPPFKVELQGAQGLSPELRQFVSDVTAVFNDVRNDTQAEIAFEII